MRGVQYLTDEKGKKSAVLIDLKKHGELWEEFHDAAVVRQRVNDPRISLEAVKERLHKRYAKS